jgi:hypothetical protein
MYMRKNGPRVEGWDEDDAMDRCWRDALLVEDKHFFVEEPLSGEPQAKTKE